MMSLLLSALLFAPAEPAPKKDYTGDPVAHLVHYSGRVQGVGFRDTAVSIARSYPVTGWVKNLDDGRVQLLVEGPDDAVKDFRKAIRDRWPKHIDKEAAEQRKVTGKYKSFAVER